jgi:hypothetical protein
VLVGLDGDGLRGGLLPGHQGTLLGGRLGRLILMS